MKKKQTVETHTHTAVETMKTKTKMVRKKIMMKEMPQKGSEKKTADRRISKRLYTQTRTHIEIQFRQFDSKLILK